MATDQPRTTRARQHELYTDLFEAIAVNRAGDHAREMATALLRKERRGDQLVGLVDDYRRAVFYSATGRTLVAYEFDEHGISETDVDTLWRALGDAASWVDAHADDLDWIHPRHRWVRDADADTWQYGH